MELQQLESWLGANNEALWWTAASLAATLGLFLVTRFLWNHWAASRARAQEDEWWNGYREGERKGASQASADVARLTRDLSAARSDAQSTKLDADKRYAVAEGLEDKALKVAANAAAEASAKVTGLQTKLEATGRLVKEKDYWSADTKAQNKRLQEAADQLKQNYRELKAAYDKIAKCPHPKTFAAFNRQYRGDGPRSYLKFGDYCTSCGMVLPTNDNQQPVSMSTEQEQEDVLVEAEESEETLGEFA